MTIHQINMKKRKLYEKGIVLVYYCQHCQKSLRLKLVNLSCHIIESCPNSRSSLSQRNFSTNVSFKKNYFLFA